jgi:aminomethyltransferase
MQDLMAAETSPLRRTSLHALHAELGGRMVPFAGYAMPVQFEGILAEHRWTREHAGLFDVSHMGQAFLRTAAAEHGAEAAHAAVAAAIETLVPGDIRGLQKGGLRYSMLLSQQGGILDDLMIARPLHNGLQGLLFLVVNAATKADDFRLIGEALADRTALEIADDRALLALQGPQAAAVLAELLPKTASQSFMTMRPYDWEGADLIVSRSGYTGEDGFEISVPAAHVERLARRLLADAQVKPIGLGARDSLRLEAGLPLYGHDLDTTTSPVEAGLGFAIGKRRRQAGGFPGAERILRELADGPARKRVGIRPLGRAPIREGAEILAAGGAVIGRITSGGFAATLNAPIAMGYVAAAHAAPGSEIMVRGRRGEEPAAVVALPFVPHRYVR